MRHRLLTILFLPALLSVVVGGCSSGGGKKAAAPTTATTAWNAPGASGAGGSSATVPGTAPPEVTVRAHEYGFDAPAEVEGGVVRLTLQNDGKLKHEAVIVEAGDTPLDGLRQDLTPVVRGDGRPVPAYLHFRGGVSLVPSGTSSSATLTLPAGRYVLVCTLTDADSQDAATSTTGATAQSRADAVRFHFDRGMAVPFEVKTANAAVMPATDGTVVARDWAFDLPPLAPGARTLTFRNDGQQDHSLGLAEFDDGIDAATAKGAFDQFLAAEIAGRPPPENLATPTDVSFAGPLSAGGQTTFTIVLKPNRTYVFACYMADRSGGPRHAGGKGMVAYVTTPAA